MTTQCEQLELAARACGIAIRFDSATGRYFTDCAPDAAGIVTGTEWNPIDNSADCAAMCAKLSINIRWMRNWRGDVVAVEAMARRDAGSEWADTIMVIEDHNNDPEAAWRAASVAVAAEIGRRMKA